MDSKIQLLSLIFSFIYGFIFFFITKYNFFIIDNLKKNYQIIITLIFTLDMYVIYSIFMYIINNGNIHIYFILILIIGFLFGYYFDLYVKFKYKS